MTTSQTCPCCRTKLVQTNPRYMIDMNTYRQMHAETQQKQRDDLGQEVMQQKEPPEEPFVLLLPANIQGFGMHDKKVRLSSHLNALPSPHQRIVLIDYHSVEYAHLTSNPPLFFLAPKHSTCAC